MQLKDNDQFSSPASRPDMPEYGLLDADQGQGLLPWRWAQERLAQLVVSVKVLKRPGQIY